MVTEGVEPCVYCGVPADSIDHIPPRHMRKQLQALGTYQGVIKEVPACRWCNSVLGCRPLLNIQDRRLYIKEHIRRKHKRLLAGKTWSDLEIAAMGPGMQGYLRENKALQLEIRARLAWAGNAARIHVDEEATIVEPEGNQRPSDGIGKRTSFALEQTVVRTSPHHPERCVKNDTLNPKGYSWNPSYRRGYAA